MKEEASSSSPNAADDAESTVTDGESSSLEVESVGQNPLPEPPEKNPFYPWGFATAGLIVVVILLVFARRSIVRGRKDLLKKDSPDSAGKTFSHFLRENSNHSVSEFYLEELVLMNQGAQDLSRIEESILADAEIRFSPEELDSWLKLLLNSGVKGFHAAVDECGVPYSEKTMVHDGPLENPRDSKVVKIIHRGLATERPIAVLLPALVKAAVPQKVVGSQPE